MFDHAGTLPLAFWPLAIAATVLIGMRGFNLVTAWTLLAAGAKLVYDGLAG